jgi:hypothetical protein
MEKRFFVLRCLVLIMGGSLVCGMAHADTYMKQKHHQDGVSMMGSTQPDKDYVEETWITNEGMRSDNPENSHFMLVNDNKMVMIDHKNKKYTEMPLDMGEMMDRGMEGEDAEDKAAFQAMMGNMMKMDVTIEPTDETKKINKWNCRKYIMTMNTFAGATTSEIWASQDLKIDEDLYSQFASVKMGMMPGMQKAVENIEKEMKKIKGVQVLNTSTSKIMNQSVTSSLELLEYRQAKAPADLFRIPKGYVKDDEGMGAPASQRSGKTPSRGYPDESGDPEEEMPDIPIEGKEVLKSIFNMF